MLSNGSVEAQARFVTNVVTQAGRTEHRKAAFAKQQKGYSAEMRLRSAGSLATQPAAGPGARPLSMNPSPPPHQYEQTTTTWAAPPFPKDTIELLGWICHAGELMADVDCCAPPIASGSTDAEAAEVLGAAQQLTSLRYSSAPGASRLAPILVEALREHEQRRGAVHEMLDTLPRLLRALSAEGDSGPAISRARWLPPAFAASVLTRPAELRALTAELTLGGVAGGHSRRECGQLPLLIRPLLIRSLLTAWLLRHHEKWLVTMSHIHCKHSECIIHLRPLGFRAAGSSAMTCRYRAAARSLIALLGRWRRQQCAAFVSHPPRLRAKEIHALSPRLRAAVVAAAAAAAALCQACRWAEAGGREVRAQEAAKDIF
jgi:hypothetical protein